jgi:hypothetical protein
MIRSRHAAVFLLLGCALAGCSQQDAPTSAPAAQAPGKADEAAKKLATYQQLVSMHNDTLAVSLGKEIVETYPGTPAATEIQKSLPALEASATAAAETSRLENLWQYQTAPMQGGTQNTATIYSSQPAGEDRVRLVLRRHTDWGQSAFLFGSGKGFQCAGDCNIAATFDGKAKTLKGYLPPTGEPAIFIKDDPAFIAALQKARRVTLDVVLKSRGKTTLVFETGGYDPAKWPTLAKSKKK